MFLPFGGKIFPDPASGTSYLAKPATSTHTVDRAK